LPIVRKLTTVGEARGLTLPKSWIENAEREAGKKIIALALEINGAITIQPIFEKRKKAGA
jgi:hypothetical protein